MKLEEAIVASLEKIADALGVEVAELFRPSDNAKIICPPLRQGNHLESGERIRLTDVLCVNILRNNYTFIVYY